MEAKSRLKRGAIHIAGWGFILLGVIGLVLPILQGILFILVGLLLLSTVSPWAARVLEKLRRRFPRLSTTIDRATPRARNAQKRIAAHFDGMKSKAKGAHAKIFRKKARRTRKE
jgi:uncharacterized membrane protein YbaN (DUF454 family)